MAARLTTGAGVALALVLLFAVNILASRTLGPVRIDLTEGNLFTLSEGTRNVLAGLRDPVTLRFYLSRRELERAPGIGSYADRVRALLNEYQRLSGGKVTLHVIDPEPFSEEEDRAVGYGLRGVPLGLDEGVLYFGLAGTNSVDDEEVIPFFTIEREAFLEYDVTKLVHGLAQPERKVVGLLSSLPVGGGQDPQAALRGQGAQPWMIVEQMRQLFEVRSLAPELAEVPEDVDVLMLVHPRELPPETVYAIDQYVLRGGRVVAFVDPYSEAQLPGTAGGFMQPISSRRSGIDALLSAWGVALGDEVVADLDFAPTVRMDQGGRVLTFDYPVWLNVTPHTFDPDDIVTGDLGNVAFGTPGYLEPAEGATTAFTPLITTTPRAALFTGERVDAATASDPRELLDEYAPRDRAYTMVARVSGKVGTAFPGGRPLPEPREEPDGEPGEEPAEAGETGEAGAAHVSESAEDVQIILVADADMLADRFWVVVEEFLGSRLAVPSAANNALVINAIDNLTGSGDLISVRNRGTFTRPFTRVAALRQRAERAYRAKEQELIARLEETERRLGALEESNQGNDGVILTDAQRDEILGFRQERVRIRKDLREVRRQLRADIEGLESWLKFANIGLVPILIGIGGLVAGLVQARRRRAAGAGAAPA